MNRYPACDDILTWDDICNGDITSPFQNRNNKEKKPFAIAIGMRYGRHQKKSEIIANLKNLSLEEIHFDKIHMNNKKVYGLIMANKYFEEILD